VQISFFALEGVLPVGVALLLAAIAGVLLVAIPGSLRIIQLRRAAAAARPGRVDGAASTGASRVVPTKCVSNVSSGEDPLGSRAPDGQPVPP
jgi:hypothetical protein